MATAEGAKPAQQVPSDPSVTSSPSTSTTTESKWKGRIVKRFKLVDELGVGAMGRVFVAEDTVLKRHVALKLLPSRFRDGRPNHRTERLIKEARSVASLEHPNTLSIYEIDQSGGVHYIAMELAEGGDLEHLVQLSGPMEVERACQLAAEAAEALAHAHKRGIVHRDVKPANLLLTRSGRCKVCDFGLALYEETTDGEARMRCVGTPNFIAPEIAQGRGATAASDIYSLGCTLFFLLTGRAPFSGPNSREVMKQHISAPLPDLRKWRPDVPERLAAAIERACSKDPAKRFDSAERFAKVLRTFTIPTASSSAGGFPAVGESTAPLSEPYVPGSGSALPPISAAQLAAIMPPPPSESEKSRHPVSASIMWAGIGTIAAALLIGLGVWLSRSNPSASNASPTPAAPSSPPAPSPTIPTISPGALVAPRAAADTNVLNNGDLETLDGKGRLDDWTVSDRSLLALSLPDENGNRFVRLTNTDPSQNVIVDQKIDLDPSWKSLKITARLRAKNLKLGSASYQDARVSVAFQNAQGTRISNWLAGPAIRTDSADWVQPSVTLDVPNGAKILYLELAMLNATGQADFDDIFVVPQKTAVAPSAAAPPAAADAPIAPSAPSTVAGADVLNNGSMETPDTDDGLAGWFIHERFQPQAQIITENGNRFLRLTNDDFSRTVFADQTIKVDPSWKAVTVSARMRATNFKLGKLASQDGRVAFAYRDASGNRIGNWPPVPRVQKDTPWITRTVTSDVPPGAKTIYIQLAILYATGMVDFDDVSVVPQIPK